MIEMKTLTIDGNTYEVVDDKARTSIEDINNIVISETAPEDGDLWLDTSIQGTGSMLEIVVATMVASSWSDNTYSFESEYPNSEYNVSIEVAPTATVEQFEAFGEAMICGSHDSNVATAINGAPTIDIPVIIKAVRK